MTVPTVLPHYRAVHALLAANPDLTVYEGEVEPTPPTADDGRVRPYAVLYFTPGRTWSATLCRTPREFVDEFQVTAAGGDQQRALLAADWVRAALVDVVPTVTGRSCWPIRQGPDAGPVRRDDGIRPPRFFVPLLFVLRSTAT